MNTPEYKSWDEFHTRTKAAIQSLQNLIDEMRKLPQSGPMTEDQRSQLAALIMMVARISTHPLPEWALQELNLRRLPVKKGGAEKTDTHEDTKAG